MTTKKQTATGRIYTLTDPRDRTIRYVGQTKQTLDARLAGHVTGPTNPAMRIWINKLVKRGLTPQITSIATVPVSELDAEEKRQIDKHAKSGHRLFNAPYYKANMGDLTNSGVRPSGDWRATAAARRKEVFGGIASARAENSMTRWAAAPRVIARIPLLVAVNLADTFRASRYFRKAAFVGLAIAGAWTIGFDRLMRRFIWGYVPQDRIIAFWHAYLAQPMAHLAILFAAGFVLDGWSEYAQAAKEAGVPPLMDDPARKKTRS